MKLTSFLPALLCGAAIHLAAAAASQTEYLYIPVEGIHETQYFHGCYDHTDGERRPTVSVIMRGLNAEDVFIETQAVQTGKPATEMITFRLKNMNASLRVQFRSSDGPHCQQGVQSIAFKNATFHNQTELAARR